MVAIQPWAHLASLIDLRALARCPGRAKRAGSHDPAVSFPGCDLVSASSNYSGELGQAAAGESDLEIFEGRKQKSRGQAYTSSTEFDD